MKDNLKTTIGLEIHIQLLTKRKMFCFCSNKGEDEKPNKYICPICLGMPGTLPVPNEEAIKLTVKLGLALDCEIAKKSKFDRKHYFYPDLPKGYQISQYDMPFVKSGKIMISSDSENFEVGINRIHLEEDAGKLIHSRAGFTIVDLNRAGTPLAELVSEPDIKTPAQAKLFMQELHKIVKAIGISSANMEKGHLRCDANISVSDGNKRSPIVEIKNLNSFKFVEKALAFEESRLKSEFDKFTGSEGKITRGFDSKKGETYQLRYKEEAKDYRYFPEPDIPPFDLSDKSFIDIEELKGSLPELPSMMVARACGLGLSTEDAQIISSDIELYQKFQDCISEDREVAKRVAKLLINEKNARSADSILIIKLAKAIKDNRASSNIVRGVLAGSLDLDEYLSRDGSEDGNGLMEIVDSVCNQNLDVVNKYKSGKKEVIGFLVGQVMKKGRGGIDPARARKVLEEKLES